MKFTDFAIMTEDVPRLVEFYEAVFQTKAEGDAEYERLKALDVEFVTMPTTWPWGARSMHFRDPDGNIVCFRTLP